MSEDIRSKDAIPDVVPAPQAADPADAPALSIEMAGPDRDEPSPAASRRRGGWGVPVSVGVHALIALILVFGLPLPQVEPQQPQAIAVALVPPPEPEAAPEEEQQEEEPPPEETPAEEEQTEEEQPQEEPAQQQASAGEEDRQVPIPTLRPVFEFGEQDSGPRATEDGGTAREPETPPDEPAPEEPQTEEAGEAEITLLEPLPELEEARTLYSEAATGSVVATTAMAGLARGLRAGELCASELREQLRHATPPLWPDILPTYRLPEGTVMEVRRGAFRATGQWYDLSFLCEVDEDVTRVVSFALHVGAPIPRSQWESRGFPAY